MRDRVFGAEDGTSVRDVAERPNTFVGEAFVVALFFFRTEPDAAKRITGMVRRNTKMILGVDRLAVGVAGAVGDPRAVGGEEDGFESGDQATGGDDELGGSVFAIADGGPRWRPIVEYLERRFFMFGPS